MRFQFRFGFFIFFFTIFFSSNNILLHQRTKLIFSKYNTIIYYYMLFNCDRGRLFSRVLIIHVIMCPYVVFVDRPRPLTITQFRYYSIDNGIFCYTIDCPVGAARVLSDYTAAELLYYSPIDYRHPRTKWFFWTAAQSTVPPNYAWSRRAKSIIPSPLPRHIFDVNPFIYTISRRVFAESPSVVWYRRKSCILRSKQAPLYTATNAIQYNMVDMHF